MKKSLLGLAVFLLTIFTTNAQTVGEFKIKNLDINNEQSDMGISFYHHGRVVFASTRPSSRTVYREWKDSKLPYYDMYMSNIIDTTQLDEPLLVDWPLSKEYNEGPSTFTADGTFMVFTVNNYDAEGVKTLKLMSSILNSKGWGKPVDLPFNNVSFNVGHPSLSYDGHTMYFASNMPGGQGGVDIWKVNRTVEGVWGYPENLGPTINTKENELFPFIHSSGLLFFSSNGRGGLGGLDVFVTNLSRGGTSVQALAAPVNSSADDFSFILAENQTTGFFASNREDGKGADDLYSFKNNGEFKTGTALKGVVSDASGTPMEKTIVELQDEAGNIIATTTTDANGNYNFDVEPGKKYIIVAKKEGYFDTIEPLVIPEGEKEVIKDITIAKMVKMALIGRVTDNSTGYAIAGAKVTVFDNASKIKQIYTTDSNGSFRHPMNDKKLNENAVIDFQLEATNYLTVTRTYKRVLDHEGDYNLSLESNTKMDKIQTGVTRLEQLIDVKPIYYDLGSSEIRPDAAKELDKIVKVMEENPTLEIELGSHTDSRGSDENNQILSTSRAESAAQYIKMRITNPQRIFGKGYGESKLLNKCKNNVQCTDQEHEKNRRTEFKIVRM
ncbi:MAG: OmpA family protein [Bacteroidota bacterium]